MKHYINDIIKSLSLNFTDKINSQGLDVTMTLRTFVNLFCLICVINLPIL